MAEAAKCLTDYNIKDGDFIVVMIKKKTVAKDKPKPQEVKEQPKPTEKPKEEAKKEEEPKPVEEADNPGDPKPEEQPKPVEADEETLGTLMAISGKPREMCQQAFAAAFGDPDRAF